MRRYFFDLRLVDTIVDDEGIELTDDTSAKKHALEVAQDLTRNTDGYLGHQWSCWTIRVRDESDRQLFSIPLMSV